jgi:hypothetical protein
LRTRHEQLNALIQILRDREVRANALRMRKEIEGLILLYTRDGSTTCNPRRLRFSRSAYSLWYSD